MIDMESLSAYFEAQINEETMAEKAEIDALAERIRKEIERLGACSLQNQELAVLWGQGAGRPSLENQMHLANFSVQYGFIHRVDEALTTISFRKLA